MKKIYKYLKKCRLCNNQEFSNIYSNNSSPIGDSFSSKEDYFSQTDKTYPLNILLCKKCRLAQLDIVIDNNIFKQSNLSTLQSNTGLMSHFKKSSNVLISKLNLNKKSKVLEILKDPDTYEASLLKIFDNKGYKTLGIEETKFKYKNLKSKSKKIIIGKINKELTDEISNTFGKSDLLIANNILANINNLNSYMNNIKNLISEEGSFVFESSYLYDMIKNQVFDFVYHEHLSYFCILSVKNLCKRHGLILYDFDFLNTKGGSIRYYITKNQNFKINSKINQVINKEKKFKLFTKKPYKKIKSNIRFIKNKLRSFLKKNYKYNLIGFGASVSCTTFIYEFGIEKKLIKILDDNMSKENKFSPGSKIKVVNPNNTKLTKNDIVIILAWRFKKQIINNHEEFLKKAFKVIVLWPKFRSLEIL